MLTLLNFLDLGHFSLISDFLLFLLSLESLKVLFLVSSTLGCKVECSFFLLFHLLQSSLKSIICSALSIRLCPAGAASETLSLLLALLKDASATLIGSRIFLLNLLSSLLTDSLDLAELLLATLDFLSTTLVSLVSLCFGFWVSLHTRSHDATLGGWWTCIILGSRFSLVENRLE